MIKILKQNIYINFLKPAKHISIISAFLLLGSIASVFFNGLNLDLDFTGGTSITINFSKDMDIQKIRNEFESNNLDFVKTNHFGTKRDIIIKFNAENENTIDQIKKIVLQLDANSKILEVESIGPSIGANLIKQGILAIVVALIFIMAYISARFEWRFSIGAICALIHDIIIAIGIFSVFQINFDANVLAGILTIIGYSLNDTIVVFDRIRENFLDTDEDENNDESTKKIINQSITQTLNRTIITTFTTMLVVIALLVAGGSNIEGFAITMLFGIIIGSYSSIYIASYLSYKLGVCRETVVPEKIEKEGEEHEEIL